MRSRSNALLFWPVLALVAVVDVVTKAIAERALVPQRVPHDVLGDVVRLTLVYNPGAAFGLHLGPQSRWIFTALTLVALVILARLYAATRRGDLPRVLALALVCAGAIGNLFDRLRSDLGVVDFLDVGLGTARWPTFNVADMAVSAGAVLLAWVLWQEDRAMSGGGVAVPVPPLAGAAPADRGELA
ncbi:MAG TPA: signal peptidase II [Gemmatimonadaceae bacterium]|nr:signal peptidase II [Gemmatimonadaceae bacterium]